MTGGGQESGQALGPDRSHPAADRWPQLPRLWDYCRHWDTIINRGRFAQGRDSEHTTTDR